MVNNKVATFIAKGGPYVISTAPSTTSLSVLNNFIQGVSSASVTIGPSKDNSERETRTTDVQSVWDSIDIKKFIPGMFRSALDLFREALSCYQNGAYMAACIMCRTATESILYIAVNSIYDPKKNEVSFMPPVNNNTTGNSFLSIRYEDLIKKAKKYLDADAQKWLNKTPDPKDPDIGLIRHSGDLVAHYSEKVLKELTSTCQIELWKDAKSTLDILIKTALVIRTVNDKYKSVNGIP